VPEWYTGDLKTQGFDPVDTTSVLITHLGEILRTHLGQLLSYKEFRKIIESLEPEYRRLAEEITPAHISNSSILAVLKSLLSERISIRNMHQILEAIAEVAPFTRKIEQIVEHVRSRISSQVCGDIAQDGKLKVLRLGGRWEATFHQGLRRDQKGEIIEFDVDPRQIEQFGIEAATIIRGLVDQGHQFALVCAADTRPYIRMIL
jgi:flagellar biosynthesis protein FlhA